MSTTTSATKCSVHGCRNPARVRGWCNKHACRWRRHGNPTAGMDRDAPLDVRFWSRVNKDGPTQPHMDTPCWVWTGNMSRGSVTYGMVRDGGRRMMAHRVSWAMVNGSVPDGLFVMHKCDHGPCVRPDHLDIGTNLDNIADKVRKGRQSRGHFSYRSKLTEADARAVVAAIAAGETFTAIASRFGVTRTNVYNIATGRSWRHITSAPDADNCPGWAPKEAT